MKKVLFIISSMEVGGVSKSLCSLLRSLPREGLDISLMITSPRGLFMPLLPPDVRLITNPTWEALVSGPRGILSLLRQGRPLLACGHALRMALGLVNKSLAGRLLARLMPPLEEQFDLAVDYNGQHQLYYMVNKVKAHRKFTFFHSDYSKWAHYYAADRRYYPRVDRIFTVSPRCVEVMRQYFPDQAAKIALMPNVTDAPLVRALAAEPAPEMTPSPPLLLSVGHVCANKGIYQAIAAARILKQAGIAFCWYFVGQPDHPRRYSRLIRQAGLAEHIRLLGPRANPYAYMRQATILVHLSKYEGRPLVIDEAIALRCPIVATNYSTVADQLTHGVNATVCSLDPADIAQAIATLLQQPALRQAYSNALSQLPDAQDNGFYACI